jgi:glyoxylase-like metal-dependent hydrolase (beta-lactamase superfamily II)
MISIKTHYAVLNENFTTNTYIVTDEESGEVAVIDPSLPQQELAEKVRGLNVKYIFITHGHSDHTCGAKIVRDNITTDAKIVIHKDDDEMLHDVTINEFANTDVDFEFPEIK